MDWFRWWHGTVTDPKFQWVARKSGQPLAAVIAVWAALLECASTATQCNADATRGNVASFDCNDWDVALNLEDGSVLKIFSAMEQKQLIEEKQIVAWDNPNTGALSSTDRSRLRRERLKRGATDATEMQRDATVGNDRLDKSREDKNNSAFAPPEWVPGDAWKDFEQMRAKRKKPLTDRARSLAVKELEKLRDGGNDPRAVIEQSVLHCWDSFYELKSNGRMNGHGDSSIFG